MLNAKLPPRLGFTHTRIFTCLFIMWSSATYAQDAKLCEQLPMNEGELDHKPLGTQCTKDQADDANASHSFDEQWQAAQNLDWQTQPLAQVCQGNYITYTDLAPSGLTYPLATYISAQSLASESSQISRFSGNTQLYQNNRLFLANNMVLNQELDSANFPNKLIYRAPELLITANSATVQTTNHQGHFDSTQFVFHDSQLRGAADGIEQKSEDLIVMTGAHLSYCPPGENDWAIRSSSVEFDHESGWGYAKNVRVEVLDVPVLYLPFMTFPIDDRRQSGFLYPSFSFANSSGLNVNIPYYFNLAENYDDTLTPRILAERGLLLENNFRYMNAQGSGSLETGYLHEDEVTLEDRWLISAKYNARLYGWSTYIDYNRISDNDYFTDLDSELSVSQESHLSQHFDAVYAQPKWNFSLALQQYQTIDNSTQPYTKLPQLQFRANPDFANLSPNYFVEFVSFDRDTSGLTGTDAITGERLHGSLSLSNAKSAAWGFFKPSASLWLTQYNLDNATGSDSTPSIITPVISADSGLYFDRTLASGATHTLEPRLFALYVPAVEQSDIPDFDSAELDFSYDYLFRTNRFSGRDRIGDAKQISLGVTQRYIDSTGVEKASLSVGQAYFASAQTVSIDNDDTLFSDKSDIALEATWRVNSNLYLNLDQILDENSWQPTTTNVRLSHRRGINRRVDLSYRYKADERDQSTISFLYPLSPNWSSFGRWQRDWDDDGDVEASLGVEYASCCWALQLSSRRWLTDADEFDSGFFIKFKLKGLGSAGSSTEFLEDITGFEARNDYYGF